METKKRAPILLIILSALSFIPVIGVVFGIISIIIGLTDFKRFKLVFILGVSGIALTILIYGSLFFVQQNLKKNGTIDKMQIQTTEMFLNNLSNEIENYKCKNGSYPCSLQQVSNMNSLIVVTDMFNPNNSKKKADKSKESCNYYYKVEKDTFILFSVGKDGLPFTKDDILPHDKSIKPLGE
ncbi:MAG: type II secretion system protein GspG [Bacteroidota bacterium]|nr:type II secretion system protein GspG [Bacteroidota bacterium]